MAPGLMLLFPWFAAALLLWLPRNRLFVTLSVVVLAVTALVCIASAPQFSVTFPPFVHNLLRIADTMVILYFLSEGFRHKSRPVIIAAAAQLVLFVWMIAITPHTHLHDIALDPLGLMMFVPINLVGGTIVYYALAYLKHEKFSPARSNRFLAILMAFVGVMNAIVMADSIELFFLLFELTTLASYLLIGYRQNDISITNAIRALWMNQVGGVAILLGLLILAFGEKAAYFSQLQPGTDALTAAVLMLSIAALVKGAQIPFDGWLRGAMVAPTPVSAFLHSSAMVKIAPFLILKLSPLLAGTAGETALILFGGFVFAAAGYLALSQEVFKAVLAYSTIAFLGLMMMLGAVGTPLALAASMLLIIYHALSKALLFFQAGVTEKLYAASKIEALQGLMSRAPLSAFFILFGFLTLAVPPFGIFAGKLLAMHGLASMPLGLGLIAVGSATLVLLYFKFAATLFIRDGEGSMREALPAGFAIPASVLTGLLILSSLLLAPMIRLLIEPAVSYIAGANFSMTNGGMGLAFDGTTIAFWQILLAQLFVLALPCLGYMHLKGVDLVKPYTGGEKLSIQPVFYRFKAPATLLGILGGLFYLWLLVLGGVG